MSPKRSPIRNISREILQLLGSEASLSLQEITQKLKLEEANTNHIVKTLFETGLVNRRRAKKVSASFHQKTRYWYTITQEGKKILVDQEKSSSE